MIQQHFDKVCIANQNARSEHIERILARRKRDRQTEKGREGETDRQTDGRTDRDRKTEGDKYRDRHRPTEIGGEIFASTSKT